MTGTTLSPKLTQETRMDDTWFGIDVDEDVIAGDSDPSHRGIDSCIVSCFDHPAPHRSTAWPSR